jgi:hypothetical protein
MQSQEIVFMGIQTAPSLQAGKVEFPIAIGFGFPDIRKIKTILIRPNEDWELFSNKDKEKEETISGYSKRKLLSEGLAESDTTASIMALTKDRSIFSLLPDRDASMLKKLSDTTAPSTKPLSALGLFNQLVSNERFISIEIGHKLVAENYPRNSADVRWMIACYRQCLVGGGLEY